MSSTCCSMLAILLALTPATAFATHLGLEQLGLESSHTETWVGPTGVAPDAFGPHLASPFPATDSASAVPPYGSSLTSQSSLGLASATAQILYSPGTFPILRLTSASDVTTPSGESVASAYAYFQDEITITVASLPANTVLSFTPGFTVSGSLSAVDDLFRPGVSTFSISAARLNAGVGGTLAADQRLLYDQICTPGDTVNCGAFALTLGTLPSSPSIDFFNGAPFTFKFWASTIAANTADADLGSSIGWSGATVRDSSGNVLSAVIGSGSGIDYTVPSVPEPGSGALLALATLALLRVRRWRG